METQVIISFKEWESLKAISEKRPCIKQHVSRSFADYTFYECDDDAIKSYQNIISAAQDEIDRLNKVIEEYASKNKNKSFFQRLFGC